MHTHLASAAYLLGLTREVLLWFTRLRFVAVHGDRQPLQAGRRPLLGAVCPHRLLGAHLRLPRR